MNKPNKQNVAKETSNDQRRGTNRPPHRFPSGQSKQQVQEQRWRSCLPQSSTGPLRKIKNGGQRKGNFQILDRRQDNISHWKFIPVMATNVIAATTKLLNPRGHATTVKSTSNPRIFRPRRLGTLSEFPCAIDIAFHKEPHDVTSFFLCPTYCVRISIGTQRIRYKYWHSYSAHGWDQDWLINRLYTDTGAKRLRQLISIICTPLPNKQWT